MILASKTTIARVTGAEPYPSGVSHPADAAKVNQAVVAKSGGKLPCYALPGKRVAFKWVSVGSSAVISRSIAQDFLRRVGVDINEVE